MLVISLTDRLYHPVYILVNELQQRRCLVSVLAICEPLLINMQADLRCLHMPQRHLRMTRHISNMYRRDRCLIANRSSDATVNSAKLRGFLIWGRRYSLSQNKFNIPHIPKFDFARRAVDSKTAQSLTCSHYENTPI